MGIYHIVLIKFTAGTADEEIERWKEAALGLQEKIPVIKKVEVGKKIPHPFDQGWDNAVIFHFGGVDEMQSYFPHHEHIAYQKAFSSIIQDRLCFDFDVE
ncbi:hypothetical protein JAAARDRAFT_203665 [Jaapia argillacea MUCL 33604]|uniref:Stress-response A/B barrel domain-containing protein n=1 Tax=Jaapia argillacea MUCL 33604 TaxID=933084 RepID=A0A067Q8R8_9AGAM|nr:hypothetical protein JAAARDRAFT_203665 [Jaapia argillacea MUCL 33604]